MCLQKLVCSKLNPQYSITESPHRTSWNRCLNVWFSNNQKRHSGPDVNIGLIEAVNTPMGCHHFSNIIWPVYEEDWETIYVWSLGKHWDPSKSIAKEIEKHRPDGRVRCSCDTPGLIPHPSWNMSFSTIPAPSIQWLLRRLNTYQPRRFEPSSREYCVCMPWWIWWKVLSSLLDCGFCIRNFRDCQEVRKKV